MKQLSHDELKHCTLKILKFFDSLCKKNNIKYSLAYGTLLGAVRHQGFIPWDDDVDVFMTRRNFEKILESNELKTGRYQLLSVRSKKNYTLPLAKIIDTSTELYQYSHEKEIVLGVFIDVFILDAIPENRNLRKIYFYTTSFFQRAWNLCQRKNMNKSGLIGKFKFVFRGILKIIGPRNLSLALDRFGRIFINTQNNYYSNIMFSIYGRNNEIFSSKQVNEIVELKFEDCFFYCFLDYEILLGNWYKDYMKLPPEDKRISHHEFEAYWK